MMKLKYSATRTITTADLYDATDPPLIFEVRVRAPAAWAKQHAAFEDDGSKDPVKARELIALVFLTVSDGAGAYEIDTVEKVEAMQAAIEEANPGEGETFICNTAWAFGVEYYSFLGSRLGKSLVPLPRLNGSAAEKTPV